MSYICKIATLDEMEEKWNYEIEHAKDKYNWKIWKMLKTMLLIL